MTTDEQLTALTHIIVRLQNENNRLRDALTGLSLEAIHYRDTARGQVFLNDALKNAQGALIIRYGDDDPDPDRFDDSFMDRLSDEDNEEDEK